MHFCSLDEISCLESAKVSSVPRLGWGNDGSFGEKFSKKVTRTSSDVCYNCFCKHLNVRSRRRSNVYTPLQFYLLLVSTDIGNCVRLCALAVVYSCGHCAC